MFSRFRVLWCVRGGSECCPSVVVRFIMVRPDSVDELCVCGGGVFFSWFRVCFLGYHSQCVCKCTRSSKISELNSRILSVPKPDEVHSGTRTVSEYDYFHLQRADETLHSRDFWSIEGV